MGHLDLESQLFLNLLSLIDRPSSGSINIENKIINFNNSKKMTIKSK